MITLKSDSDILTNLDQCSYSSLIELIIQDCLAYTQKFPAKGNEWIPRILVCKGSDHEGSTIKYGLYLLYQFRRVPFCFDLGIREIRIAETMDEFLDLYNEIRKDPDIDNKQKRE